MIRRPPAPHIARALPARQTQQLARAKIAAASDAAKAHEDTAEVADITATQFEEERSRISNLESRVSGLEQVQ